MENVFQLVNEGEMEEASVQFLKTDFIRQSHYSFLANKNWNGVGH